MVLKLSKPLADHFTAVRLSCLTGHSRPTTQGHLRRRITLKNVS